MSAPITPEALPDVTRQLLDDVEAALSRYVIFPTEEHRTAASVWVLHTHVSDAFDTTPRLAALSPEKGSGKTRLLEILSHLCHLPIHAANASTAAMFRVIAKAADGGLPPTMLLDEADSIFGPKVAAQNEELRGLINAGHRRGVGTLRCVGDGASMTVTKFEAYAPVALAGIGQLPETVMHRAVVIPMRRRAPGESVRPFRLRNARDELDPIRDALATWGRVATDELGQSEPSLPYGVEDRPADVWEPLLAIGELAGDPWTSKVRSACKVIVTNDRRRDAEDSSLGLRLLSDLRDVFGDRDSMTSADIIAALCDLEEAPWSDLYGKPIDPRKLARYLKPYDVSSTSILVDGKGLKGYRREDLYDPWARYLPPLGPPPEGRDIRDVRDDPPVIDHIAQIAAPEKGSEPAPCVDCGEPSEATDLEGLDKCADCVRWPQEVPL